MALATTWMDLEIILLSEVIETEKDIEYDITYMCNLKNKHKNKQSRRYRGRPGPGDCQRGGAWGRRETGEGD